jgi:predicted phage-related endonuclease
LAVGEILRFTTDDRALWLARRQALLGASDFGAAYGCDEFRTALDVYAEKAGLVGATIENDVMRRGRLLEPAVIAAVREEHPDWDVRYPLNLQLVDADAKIGCTPDAVAQTDEPGLTNLQCKVISRRKYDDNWLTGPPLKYKLQCLVEGRVMDAARSIIAVLIMDTYSVTLALHPVPRNEAGEAAAWDFAATFWANVAAGVMPAVDLDRDAETLATIYPQSEADPVLDLSADNRLPELLPIRARLKAEIASASKEIERVDNEIKAKLGTHERATLPGWAISWKTQHNKERFQAAYDSRPLRVTAKGEAA